MFSFVEVLFVYLRVMVRTSARTIFTKNLVSIVMNVIRIGIRENKGRTGPRARFVFSFLKEWFRSTVHVGEACSVYSSFRGSMGFYISIVVVSITWAGMCVTRFVLNMGVHFVSTVVPISMFHASGGFASEQGFSVNTISAIFYSIMTVTSFHFRGQCTKGRHLNEVYSTRCNGRHYHRWRFLRGDLSFLRVVFSLLWVGGEGGSVCCLVRFKRKLSGPVTPLVGKAIICKVRISFYVVERSLLQGILSKP